MKIVFLGCDGVVNGNVWSFERGKWVCKKGSAEEGTVTDTQAVQWLSEFCERMDYEIVFLGSWKDYADPAAALRKAGLRESVKIWGNADFSMEIIPQVKAFLEAHESVEDYVVVETRERWENSVRLDDDMEEDMLYSKYHLVDHAILCGYLRGFGENEYNNALVKAMAPVYMESARGRIGEDRTRSELARAVFLLFEHGTLSTSVLQRKLTIGYGRAAKLIDRLAELKILARTQAGSIVPAMEYSEAVALVRTYTE